MLTIEFKTDNASFADGTGANECAAILRKIAIAIANGIEGESYRILDSNGNTIGRWSLSIDADQEGGE